jgi:hypothetical protein
MIEQTKLFETPYFKRLNEVMGGLLNDDLVRIDVVEEINKLNDTFRKPSFANEAIEQMQKKQEK